MEDFNRKSKEIRYIIKKKDAKRLGIKKCYCHNDIYEPNFLVTEKGGYQTI